MNKYKKVEVEWFDAQTNSGYADDIGNLKDWIPVITYSCGYLIYEDEEKIILGFMLFGEDTVKHCQMIPRAMVKKITELIEK